MTKVNIIRAWKDATYFASLTDAEKAAVPANPAGNIALGADMQAVVGGSRPVAAMSRLAASCTGGNTCCTTTKTKKKVS